MLCSKTPNAKSRPTSSDPSKYKKIGNYVLLKTIGRGTFGKVKIGTHLITQQKVAIKILDRDKIINGDDLERISREIHILKALRHPNIAQLYENTMSEKHIYIIMEYVEGHHLFDFIYSKDKNRLTEAKTCELFKQLISAVEYIHTLGIVHRDIKPDNILLNKSKKIIKLADFGLSNSYKHGDLLKTACGSPCYASPEMVSNQKYNGLYSDLWSCGVVLYCMLVGNLPFEDEDVNILYSKIKTADYYMPDYLSPIAQDLLTKILQTDPNQRIKLENLKNHPFFSLSNNHISLSKGILIGLEPIPVDHELISEIKRKFYSDKNKVTEAFIEENITSNQYNNVTVIYYLMLNQKNKEKQYSSNNPLSITSNERKKCDNTFNLQTIKKMNFDNKKRRELSGHNRPKGIFSNNQIATNHNNTNNSRYVNKINSGNNQVNLVVINNIVADTTHGTKNAAKSLSKKKNNSLTLNLNNNTKMNTTTTFNNNILTTKINFNEMISNQISKQNNHSRNTHNDSQVKRNKTVSSLTNKDNLTLNLNSTLTHQLKGIISKSKGNYYSRKKYLFNSPNHSTDNLQTNINTINMRKILSRNSKSKPTKERAEKNKLLIKRIFDNESFHCDEINSNNNNHNVSLNITNYFGNTHKKFFSKDKNNKTGAMDNAKKTETTHGTIQQNPMSNTNNKKKSNTACQAPNLKIFQCATKIQKAKNMSINTYLKNNFSLSKCNSKEKTFSKVLTEKSLSKDKTKQHQLNVSQGKTKIIAKSSNKMNEQLKPTGIKDVSLGKKPVSKEKKSYSLTKKLPANILKNKSFENTLLKPHLKNK